MTKIPDFLKKELTKKRTVPKFFPSEMKEFIHQYGIEMEYPTKNLEGDKLLSLWFRFMKSNITEVGICGFNGCTNKNKIVNDSKSNGFKISVGCCVKHSVKKSMMEKYGVENAMNLQSTKDKIKKTTIERYGVENAAQSKIVQDKMKKTNLERYGVENVFQSEEKKDKIKATMLARYGVENISQSDEIKAKKIETSLKNYGVSFPSQSKIIQDKMKNTNLERYGVPFASQSEEFQSKQKTTMVERYGVENASQVEEFQTKKIETFLRNYGVDNPMKLELIQAKSRKTCLERYGVEYPTQNPIILEKQQKNSFRRKIYRWKTGEISILQGYEPIVLKELEDAGYSYGEVLTDLADMPYIEYQFEGKKHVYFPDFYIPSENKIIEVKSEYTLKKELEQNIAKFDATKGLGFKFLLEVR